MAETYSSPGTTVTLHENRLEIKIGAKTEIIPYRNIASVEKPPILNAIDIRTNDGKKRRVALLPPSKTEQLRQRILELL